MREGGRGGDREVSKVEVIFQAVPGTHTSRKMPPQCEMLVLLLGLRSFLQPSTPSVIPTTVSTITSRDRQQMMIPNAYLYVGSQVEGGREGWREEEHEEAEEVIRSLWV